MVAVVAMRHRACMLGRTIAGRYVLDDVLGIGGMGVVHRARQQPHGREVAVKIPRAELAHDPLVRELFRGEARAGSRVAHRNVVGVLDHGDDGGVPYLVMDHITGPRLGQLLRQGGALPLAAALDLVRQIVAGLAHVHEQRIVHADVKCDNVIVERAADGALTPRLIDFGIARFVDEPAPRCEAFVSGTPEYVAPEVAGGQRPTPAADVYAIGVMLYELITGRAPFEAAWRCPDLAIPDALDALVARTLARDPRARPGDGGELARCLAAIAPPPGLAARAPARRPTAPTVRAKPPRRSVAERRLTVIAAIKSGDAEQIANAYLELARALGERGEQAAAIDELDEGIALLMTPGARGPVWRLLVAAADRSRRFRAT